MKITFLGAAKTVTGSCYLIETDSSKFIVDCGMFQGHSKEIDLNVEKFPFNPSSLDFMLLTHSHIDHSGRIPKLYIEGFNSPIYATKPTVELCEIMLPDSGHIQEMETEWLNRKRIRAGKHTIKPVYTYQNAIDCLTLFNKVSYGEIIKITDSIRVRFNDAGHILGSSIIEIWANEDGKETKIVFSGDLGNKNMPILRDPTIIESADYLVIESTYGDRLHDHNEDKVERFVDIINSTIKKGGNVIVPSFAVGRAQEIIYDLHKQREKYGEKMEAFMNIPVFVDSPLTTSATEVFRKNLDCFDEEARSYVENGDNPLDFKGLQFTQSVEESIALNESSSSKIIISASGMCEAGRIKHHLKHNLWRWDSTILFVGYQAVGSLGRKLVDGAKKVKLFGEEITVNARIEMIEGFSGHADKAGLMDWIGKISNKPKKIFIVHGEEEPMANFSQSIKDAFNIETIVPNRGESFIVDSQQVAEVEERIQSNVKFVNLEIIDYLEKLKEEMDNFTDIMKVKLKQGKSDHEIDLIKQKISLVEKALADIK